MKVRYTTLTHHHEFMSGLVCASPTPTYLRRYGIPQTLEDLKHHNCISFVSPWIGRVFDWQFQQDGQEVRLPVEGNLRLNNGEAILDVALAGVGLVQVDNYIAGSAIALSIFFSAD